MDLRERALKRVSDLIYLHHKKVLLVAVVVTIFLGYCLSRLELRLGFVDMLSENDPAVIQYNYAVENFGTLSYLFIVLESDDPGLSKAYADALAERLERRPEYIKRVYYRFEVREFLDDALLFLLEDDLLELSRIMDENQGALSRLARDPGLLSVADGLDRVLADLLASGELPEPEAGIDMAAMFDPVIDLIGYLEARSLEGDTSAPAFSKDTLAALVAGGHDLPFDISESYLFSKDKKHLLLLAAPSRPADNFEWCREFMEAIESELAELDRDMPGVWHGVTGNAAVMRDDDVTIRADMKRTTLVAFVLIIILFAYSFRNLSSILMAGLGLGLGLMWAFGAAYLTVGYLTAITSVFGAILLGLGIDYAILFLSRYTEERNRGHTIKGSLDITLTQTGKGVLTGATATSLAFFAITAGSFRGGKEMGIVSGCGIIIFYIVMSFVLTSLLVWRDTRRALKGPGQKKFNPVLMRAIGRVVNRAYLPVFIILLALFGYMAYLVPRYSFEYNYLKLEPQNVQSIKLIEKIPQWFDIDTNYGMIVSKDLDQDREFTKKLLQMETISQVESISSFIPEDQDAKLENISNIRRILDEAAPDEPESPSEQREFSQKDTEKFIHSLHGIREKVKDIKGLAFLGDMEDIEDAAGAVMDEMDDLISGLEKADMEKVRSNLALLDAELAGKVKKGIQRFKQMTRTKGITLETLKQDHPEIIERFQGKDKKFLIYAYPSEIIWKEEVMKAVVRDLKDVSPDAMGMAVIFNHILDQLKQDFLKVALIALGVVFFVILMDYRRLSHTLLTLMPLVFGVIMMVGVMNFFGMKFNIINIGMVPLIIGIGIDYGVYIVHRWISEGKGISSLKPIVESTGRAVALSALTTMIGFGAIMLANYQGLVLMSQTLVMGIGFCLLAAVIMLPSLLLIMEKIRARRKSSHEK
jgi:hopanoid biosynthesis associated RND transporter like protein HpnN